MHTYRLALIGFGNVGQGFTQILRDHGERLARQFGAQFQLVAVSTRSRGGAFNADGLDPAQLLAGAVPLDPAWDALRIIDHSHADVVIEVSPTDLITAEPALTHVRRALTAGRHVITANKGPIALHFPELQALAQAHHVTLGFEGTVMGGTPSLRLAQELLAGANLRAMRGILNGTTNYILTQMDNGAAYADALAEAQVKGYAETDPTGDVEGYDAAIKVVILANCLLGQALTLADVDRHGITALTPADVAEAQAHGERWKLIGRVEWLEGQVRASVRPTRLPLAHPLASVSGATNALTFSTELLGDVTLIGPGAGRVETGYGLLTDLLALHRQRA